MSASLVQRVVEKVGVAAVLEAIPLEQRARFMFEWKLWARPEQLPPSGDWDTWALIAGRGFGKSRTGAEFSRGKVKSMPGSHGALIGPTSADTRDVMVKALLACTPPWEGLHYEPSKRLLSWRNGTTATLYSAEEPDRLRGPQHHWAWADEVAAWAYADEVWDMLAMTMRLGDRPQICATTTPRPIPLIRRILADPRTVPTRGSTFDNAANLSKSFLAAVRQRYEGTRLGRQELWAEILEDVPGALWTRAIIDALRVRVCPPDIVRTVVAVDPSGGAGEGNDEQGIIIASKGLDGHAYVRADRTCKESPDGWGRVVVKAAVSFQADRVLGERNFGGDMISFVVKTAAQAEKARVSYRDVVASRGKVLRAEPVAALYEQGLVHHVGCLNELEDEQCRFVPGHGFDVSPNRADALVIALTDLMLGEGRAALDMDDTHYGRRL